MTQIEPGRWVTDGLGRAGLRSRNPLKARSIWTAGQKLRYSRVSGPDLCLLARGAQGGLVVRNERPGAIPLEEWLVKVPAERRREKLRLLGYFGRWLHQRGVIGAKAFQVQDRIDGSLNLSIADLEGVRFRKHVSDAERIADLSTWRRLVMKRVSRAERFFLFDIYSGWERGWHLRRKEIMRRIR
jgi:hypothetical protein